MRTEHDRLAKQILSATLESLGRVEVEREVAPDAQSVDVYFEADGPSDGTLGLLSRIAEGTCLFEPYAEPPSTRDVRACLRKLYALHEELLKQAPAPLPRLWLVTAGRPERAIAELALQAAEGWPVGVLSGPAGLGLWMIVVPALPRTSETLPLRLLGRGRVLEEALSDLRRLPGTAPLRARLVAVVARLRPTDELQNEEESRMFTMMSKQELDGLVAEGRKEGREEGREEGRVAALAIIARRRLARELSSDERGVLAVRVRQLGDDAACDAVLSLDAAALVAWLRG